MFIVQESLRISRYPDDPTGGRFWTVFERTRVAMMLVDRECRVVDVNRAALALFRSKQESVAVNLADRSVADQHPTLDAGMREKLLRTNEAYGEQLVALQDDTRMVVRYVAHVTSISNRWLALVIVLSARPQADSPPAGPGMQPAAHGSRLTPREQDIVRRVALGASTRQIAADLHLSPATIGSHVRNAMVKNRAHTRAQLVAIALGDGLIRE